MNLDPAYDPRDDLISELRYLCSDLDDEITLLKDQLTLHVTSEASDGQKLLLENLKALRTQLNQKELELNSVKNSRNELQYQNSELIRSVKYWRKRCNKAEIKNDRSGGEK